MSTMPQKSTTDNDEGVVKSAIKKILEKHGWFHWSPPANKYGAGGISDIGAVRDRIFMVIEAKKGDRPVPFAENRPTANQIAYLQNIRGNGHWAFIVDGFRLKHLAGLLESFDRAQAVQLYNATDAGKLAPRKIEDADGAQMINCIREMQREF